MKKVEITKYIDASQQQVWNFISDVERAPEWVEVMQSLVETTDNPVKEETVYKERSKIGPKESVTTWRVVRFEPPRVQIHECNEPDFRARLTMRVEPRETGSNLYYTAEYALMPNFRPLGWLAENLFVHKSMVENLHRSVENCKRMVER